MGFKLSKLTVALLFSIAVLTGAVMQNHTHFAGNPAKFVAQVLSGMPANTTVSIRVSTEVDCELDPLTHVFFDITPPDGAEVTVNVGGVPTNFGTSESDEGGMDEYFPNGTYQALISPRVGYIVGGPTIQTFTVLSTCSGDTILPPAPPKIIAATTTVSVAGTPLPPPPAITPDETVTKSTPVPETENKEPLSSTAILLSSPKTEAIATCNSNETCAKTCTTGSTGGACSNYTTEKLLPASTAGNNNVDQAAVAVFLDERQGARIFVDSDNDGITDYDEVNIYHTDPRKSDTNGNGIPDGAELLAHTNPLSTSTSNTIAFEDPRVQGATTSKLTVASVAPEATTTGADGKVHTTAVKFSGSAPANSFVTLYIYSEPIVVTIKADADGAWVYTLDKELPDGNHEVLTAITDLGGRVLARSEPIPFVKQAEAFTVGSRLPPAGAQPSFFEGSSLMVVFLLLVIALISSLIIIATVTRRKDDGGGTPPAGPEAPAPSI